jgi:hypothetical protein
VPYVGNSYKESSASSRYTPITVTLDLSFGQQYTRGAATRCVQANIGRQEVVAVEIGEAANRPEELSTVGR